MVLDDLPNECWLQGARLAITPYSVDGAGLAFGLMLATYDRDEAAWEALPNSVDRCVLAGALRLIVTDSTVAEFSEARANGRRSATGNAGCLGAAR